ISCRRRQIRTGCVSRVGPDTEGRSQLPDPSTSVLFPDYEHSRCRQIEVVIDWEGRLRCARAVSGNPIAMASAVQSLSTWRFKPYRMRGRPATVIGFISLPFHFL